MFVSWNESNIGLHYRWPYLGWIKTGACESVSGVSLSDVGLHGFFLQGLEANDVLFFHFDLTWVTYCKYKIHTNVKHNQ